MAYSLLSMETINRNGRMVVMTESNPERVSLLAIFGGALAIFKERSQFFGVIVLICSVFEYCGSLINGLFQDGLPAAAMSIGAILFILIWIAVIVTSSLFVLDEVRAITDPEYAMAPLGGLALLKKYFWSYVGTQFLAGLIIFAGALVCLLPGLYFSVRYMFLGPVIVFESVSGSKALENASCHVKGQGLLCAGYFIFAAVGFNLPSLGVELAVAFKTIEPSTFVSIVSSVLKQLGTVFGLIFMALAYLNLRQPERF